MKRNFRIRGRYSKLENCGCEFCEGHEETEFIDTVYQLTVPFGLATLDPEDALVAIVQILRESGERAADFDKGPVHIDDLGEVPIEMVLRSIHAPMLPGFAGGAT